MSARGLVPLAIGAGIAYWAYNKKDEEDAEFAEELSPLEELALEAAAERSAAQAAEAAAEAASEASEGFYDEEPESE